MPVMQQIGMVLGLTQRGGDAIRRAVQAAGFGADGGGLRITAHAGRKGMKYRFQVEAQPSDTDYVVEHYGVRVYVDPFSAQHLDGGSVDFVANGREEFFTLTPPRTSAHREPQLVA